MNKNTVRIGLTLLLVSGCAKTPDRITATYVSPALFQEQSCTTLLAERNRIVTELDQLVAGQQKASATDAVATGIALVLFWPAALTLGVTKDNASALSSAKGHYDAISTAMQQKGCHITAV